MLCKVVWWLLFGWFRSTDWVMILQVFLLLGYNTWVSIVAAQVLYPLKAEFLDHCSFHTEFILNLFVSDQLAPASFLNRRILKMQTGRRLVKFLRKNSLYQSLIFLTNEIGNTPCFFDLRWYPLHHPSSLCLTMMTTSPLFKSSSNSLLAGKVSTTSYLKSQSIVVSFTKMNQVTSKLSNPNICTSIWKAASPITPS